MALRVAAAVMMMRVSRLAIQRIRSIMMMISLLRVGRLGSGHDIALDVIEFIKVGHVRCEAVRDEDGKARERGRVGSAVELRVCHKLAEGGEPGVCGDFNHVDSVGGYAEAVNSPL